MAPISRSAHWLARSSGTQAPSRKLKAERAWSSVYIGRGTATLRCVGLYTYSPHVLWVAASAATSKPKKEWASAPDEVCGRVSSRELQRLKPFTCYGFMSWLKPRPTNISRTNQHQSFGPTNINRKYPAQTSPAGWNRKKSNRRRAAAGAACAAVL